MNDQELEQKYHPENFEPDHEDYDPRDWRVSHSLKKKVNEEDE